MLEGASLRSMAEEESKSQEARSAVAGCPYRSHVRTPGGVETARCGFLGRVSGVEESSLLDVRRDACEVCVQLPELNENRIHHVVASHLYCLAERVLERDGVPGCDAGKAAGIRAWAEQNLKFDDGLDPVDFDKLDRIGVASECLHLGDRLGVATEERGGRTDALDVYRCRHPSRERTTAGECFTCRHWTDDPEPKPRLLRETFPEGPGRVGPKVTRWAVGVTTTRRFQPTLAYCLDSLIRAGWPEPRVFADSTVELADRHRSLPFSLRQPKLGAWPNYYLSLVELCMREPAADAYMLVQDDAILYDRENLREYLEEEVLWPSEETGLVSLYSSRAYTREDPGWYELESSWVWGALAFVFPPESVKRFVTDPNVFEHRRSGRNKGCANIDVVAGAWATRNQLRTFYPTPSLAQHVGESSTLWPTARARGSRRANKFVGARWRERERRGDGRTET